MDYSVGIRLKYKGRDNFFFDRIHQEEMVLKTAELTTGLLDESRRILHR